MNLIQGLHGAVAVVLLCSLLFAEEAGVPLPIPGELSLIAAGILIGTGGLDPWVFPPLAFASCLAGSFTGYSWARLVGISGLRSLAVRLHQGPRLDRVTTRLRQARPIDIGLSRLLPGLRVYTTLVVGAAGVSRNRFLAGIVPATALWMSAFIVVGLVAGVPAEHSLGRLESLVVQGGVLIVIGVAAFVAMRSVPEAGREVLQRLPPTLRAGLALMMDMGVLASVVAGVLAVVRPLTPAGYLAGWIDIIAVIVVIVVFYSVETQRGAHATAGETLFGTGYITRQAKAFTSLFRMLAASKESPTALSQAVERFHALSDPKRLRIVLLLTEGGRSSAQLADGLHLEPADLGYHLLVLRRARIIREVEPEDGTDERTYTITDEQIRAGISQIIGAD